MPHRIRFHAPFHWRCYYSMLHSRCSRGCAFMQMSSELLHPDFHNNVNSLQFRNIGSHPPGCVRPKLCIFWAQLNCWLHHWSILLVVILNYTGHLRKDIFEWDFFKLLNRFKSVPFCPVWFDLYTSKDTYLSNKQQIIIK